MKRSGSRASKVSNDAQDSVENSFPGIPDAKWHELLEKEETDLFILGLREEILHKCMEICFDTYLEKQAISFTVHCAYLAWCKVLNVFYMVRDPGDVDDSEEKKSWEPDLEPEPSVIDSWGSQCVVSLEPEPPIKKTDSEFEKEVCGTTSNPVTVCSLESLELCAFASELFNVEEMEYFYSPQMLSESSESNQTTIKSGACLSFDSLIMKKPFDTHVYCGNAPPRHWKKKNGSTIWKN